MTDWSSLLQRHVAAASPRPFEDVVRRVRRRRQRQVVGAALGVLLVVAGTALAVGRPAPASRPQPAATSAPDSLVVNGKTVYRDKLTRIFSVSAKVRADHLLTLVGGTREPGGPTYCNPWTVPFVLRQTADTVVVAAYDYRVPRPVNGGCFGVGYGSATLTVDLGRALGERTVVDASTGRAASTVVESDYLTSSQLPTGYGNRRAYGVRNPGFTQPYFIQEWGTGGFAQLTLVEGPPAEVLRLHVQHVGATDVRKRFGQLVRTAGGDANRCLRWQESAGDALELCTRGRTQDLLTVAQLVAFADSLNRPASSQARQQAPPTIEVQGRTLDIQGGAPFEVAYLDPGQPRDVVVQRKQPSAVGGCFPWPVLRVVSQTADVVEIGVFEYQVPKPTCFDPVPDIGNTAPDLRVTLEAPLGQRRLLDRGAGGVEALVIDPSQWLTPGYLPPGFSDQGQIPFYAKRGGGGGPVTSASWSAEHGGVQLTLQQGQAVRPGGGVVSHVIVRGHYGTYSNGPGQSYPIRCLSWLEAASDRVVLCSHGGELKHVLSDPELLRIAAALHRP